MLKTGWEISKWLKKHRIENYKLEHEGNNGDLVVNVHESVFLNFHRLKEIPIQFNTVYGHFNCSNNELTSLEGCPRVVSQEFLCSNNKLTSLEGGPELVYGHFSCDNNNLTSLEGSPRMIEGCFCCSYNELTSLEGCPKNVAKGFYFSNNHLTSLEGCPKIIEGDFDCSDNKLSSLNGCPKEIIGRFNCSYNKLISLKGRLQEINESFDCSNNNLTSLEGCPKIIKRGKFDCHNNKLTSLEGSPKIINGYFDCSCNNLISLEGCPKEVRYWFNCSYNKLTSLKGSPKIINGYFDCSNNELATLVGCPEIFLSENIIECYPSKIERFFYCYNNPIMELHNKLKLEERNEKNNKRTFISYTESIKKKIFEGPLLLNSKENDFMVFEIRILYKVGAKSLLLEIDSKRDGKYDSEYYLGKIGKYKALNTINKLKNNCKLRRGDDLKKLKEFLYWCYENGFRYLYKSGKNYLSHYVPKDKKKREVFYKKKKEEEIKGLKNRLKELEIS